MAEKLRIMEELWEDLRTRAAAVPMPQWHKDLLDERSAAITKGHAQFVDWKTAKKRILGRCRELSHSFERTRED